MEAAEGGPGDLRESSVAPSGASGERRLPSRGDPGEKEGNEVSDLSDAMMDEAELDGSDTSLALLDEARTAVDRWLLTDVPDCWDMERWSGAEGVSLSISPSTCESSSAGRAGGAGGRLKVGVAS